MFLPILFPYNPQSLVSEVQAQQAEVHNCPEGQVLWGHGANAGNCVQYYCGPNGDHDPDGNCVSFCPGRYHIPSLADPCFNNVAPSSCSSIFAHSSGSDAGTPDAGCTPNPGTPPLCHKPDGGTPTTMGISQDGIRFIAKHEGNAGMLPANQRLTGDTYGLYNDSAGYCTVGIGHLVHNPPIPGNDHCTAQDIASYQAAHPGGQSQADAEQQLAIDAASAENAVNTKVQVQLSQQQFDALVDFTFNEGVGNLGISNLLADINAGSCDAATITNDLHHFDTAGNNPTALAGRRTDDVGLFNNGNY